jgi:hypothetical protein
MIMSLVAQEKHLIKEREELGEGGETKYPNA